MSVFEPKKIWLGMLLIGIAVILSLVIPVAMVFVVWHFAAKFW